MENKCLVNINVLSFHQGCHADIYVSEEKNFGQKGDKVRNHSCAQKREVLLWSICGTWSKNFYQKWTEIMSIYSYKN